ncbi:ubiquinol-cytochrome C chaperone family protein [Tsuneonella sp. HG222]
MNLISRLLGTAPDPRDALRPLWHKTVETARDPHWYAECGVADSVSGRFDMITAVLAFVLLRLEAAGRAAESALLTELFVEDMDGQLRESGVGDLVVGKRMGRLMESLGGRLDAYRSAVAATDNQALENAAERNVTLGEQPDIPALARGLRALSAALARTDPVDLVAGRIER